MSRWMSLGRDRGEPRHVRARAPRGAWLAAGVLLLGACTEQAEPFAPTDVSSPALALVRSDWPSAQNPGVPAYARIEVGAPHVYSDGTWAVIAFYRDPGCVPAEFNLLTFFDPPRAFGCPLMVHGSTLMGGSAPGDAPKQSTTRGSSVPVWLAPAAVIAAATADGTLTIGELEAVAGLVKGTAARFHELLQPLGGGHELFKLVLGAAGTLEDGRTFSVNITNIGGDVRAIRIEVR